MGSDRLHTIHEDNAREQAEVITALKKRIVGLLDEQIETLIEFNKLKELNERLICERDEIQAHIRDFAAAWGG